MLTPCKRTCKLHIWTTVGLCCSFLGRVYHLKHTVEIKTENSPGLQTEQAPAGSK